MRRQTKITKQIKPYVYRCEHKITKKYYFGYRHANTVPAKEDLGIRYFTSSKIVANDFLNYTYEILGEYDTTEVAYKTEQYLIWKSKKDPLLINKGCEKGGYAHFFGEAFPSKKERYENHQPNKIKCPIQNTWIDPLDLTDVNYIRDRIAATQSKKNLIKWCELLIKICKENE